MAFPTTPVLDNFNRANSVGLSSANWSTDIDGLGRQSFDIVSNAAKTPSSGFGSNWWNVKTFGPDCEVHATLVAVPTVQAVRLYARVQSPGTTSLKGYFIECHASDLTTLAIYRVDNNTDVFLGNFLATMAAGDSFGFSIIGSTIRSYTKAAAGAWTLVDTHVDATYGAAGYLAMDTRNDTTTVLDNFGGGTAVRVRTATFETGANGANISTMDAGSVTPFDSVIKTGVGTTATYDNTHVYQALAGKFALVNLGQSYLTWTHPNETQTYGRMYLYNAGGWDTSAFLTFRQIGAQCCRFLLNNAERVEARNAAESVVGTSTASLAANDWNRIEWHIVFSDTVGVIEVRLFLGANADGTTPDETMGPFTSLDVGSFSDEMLFGMTSNGDPGLTVWLDNIVDGAASYPGPFIQGPTNSALFERKTSRGISW